MLENAALYRRASETRTVERGGRENGYVGIPTALNTSESVTRIVVNETMTQDGIWKKYFMMRESKLHAVRLAGRDLSLANRRQSRA